MTDSNFRNTKPLDRDTTTHQERLLLELLALFNANDVPTYFDQVIDAPRDESKPRQVMEPAQRIGWVFTRFSELKTKNRVLSEHATDLERQLRQRDAELKKANDARDEALKAVADLMLEVEKHKKSHAALEAKGKKRKGK